MRGLRMCNDVKPVNPVTLKKERLWNKTNFHVKISHRQLYNMFSYKTLFRVGMYLKHFYYRQKVEERLIVVSSSQQTPSIKMAKPKHLTISCIPSPKTSAEKVVSRKLVGLKFVKCYKTNFR